MQQLWQQVTSLLWTIVSRPTIVDILDIAIAKGKKLYDKRQSLKEKTDRREMDRNLKRY